MIHFINLCLLAPYLPPCIEADPKFDACAKASMKAAIPHILNGDPKYRIPNLNPLELTEVKVSSGELEIVLLNVKIYGVDAVKGFDDFHWDKENNIVNVSITVPDVSIDADYRIKGRILILPIQGEGPANIKISK